MIIRSVDLIFENCDMVTIDGKYIGDFLVDDIKTSIARLAVNCVEKYQTCKTFLMEIHKDANRPYNQLGLIQYETSVFERIGYNDITQIEVHLSDEDNEDNSIDETYLVCWDENELNENDNQDTYVSKNGWCYLCISQEKTISDVFDLEEINEQDYGEVREALLELGDAQNVN